MIMDHLLFCEMLPVEGAVGSRDIIEGFLKATHIALNKGNSEIKHLVCGSRALQSKTIRSTLTSLVDHKVTEYRVSKDSGDEGSDEEKLEVAKDEHGGLERERILLSAGSVELESTLDTSLCLIYRQEHAGSFRYNKKVIDEDSCAYGRVTDLKLEPQRDHTENRLRECEGVCSEALIEN